MRACACTVLSAASIPISSPGRIIVPQWPPCRKKRTLSDNTAEGEVEEKDGGRTERERERGGGRAAENEWQRGGQAKGLCVGICGRVALELK